jgi:colanic acid/amylovoran biosynthesis glycosyltransferase
MRLVELTSWPPEPFIARKLEGLARRGVSVSIAAPVGRTTQSGIAGVGLVRLPPPSESRLASVLWVARDAVALGIRDRKRLGRLIASVRPRRLLRLALPLALADPDVIQFSWLPQAARYLPLFDALECPVSVSLRGPGIYILPHTGVRAGHPRSFGATSYAGFASAYPDVFEEASAVHCVSEAIAVKAERFGLDRAKARVIRPAVDTTIFAPAGSEKPEGFRVVSIGLLTWVKGHDDALAAVAQLGQEGVPVSYEIIGHDPPPSAAMASDRERILFLIQELGLEDRVTLSGRLNRDQVRRRLRESHVLLHASYSEGIANSVLEAMACALPVVVTDVGGMSEVVDDGVQGLLCPPREPRMLAEALRSLWQDPDLARRLGEAGRARAVDEFSPAAEIEAFLDLYAQLAGEQS